VTKASHLSSNGLVPGPCPKKWGTESANSPQPRGPRTWRSGRLLSSPRWACRCPSAPQTGSNALHRLRDSTCT